VIGAMMLRIIELFAGIGSQTESLKEIGIEHEVVAISEYDKYASKAYELLHGAVNNLGDIRLIKKLPKADLWTYSFPCTDISLAGAQKGFDKGSNTQSSLLWEVERLLESAKENDTLPSILLMENVKALVSKKFIKEFDTWLKYLESLGYKNQYQVLNAKDYNTPQNRERVFLFSFKYNADYQFPIKQELKIKLGDLLEDNVEDKYFITIDRINNFNDMTNRNGFIRGLTFKPHELTSPFAYTITTRSGARSTDNFIVVPEKTIRGFKEAEVGDGIYINRPHQKRGVVQKNKIQTLKTTVNDLGVVVKKDDLISIRKITPREAWRLMGWKDDRIDLVINEFSDAQLYKMAGNGIVVKVLEVLFKNLDFEVAIT
jgi:DNA (cytosine-5)-methyltransferase 1